MLYTCGIMPSAVLSSTDVLSGKVLIDCNNWDIPEGYAYEPIVESLTEKLAADVPNTHVVKARPSSQLALEALKQGCSLLEAAQTARVPVDVARKVLAG